MMALKAQPASAVAAVLALVVGCSRPPSIVTGVAANISDWPAYGHSASGDRHSPLTEITRTNVSQLTVAWRYHTGEVDVVTDSPDALETTPIVVDGVMFVSTPLGRIVALEPTSGQEIWSYDFRVDPKAGFGDFVSRGVSYWRDSSAAGECSRRIFAAIVDARLVALDAASGKPCVSFGNRGSVDLRAGLRRAPQTASEYEQTSPPAVINDLVVVGSAIADNGRTDMASGEVRAFDARTGALRWTWDPVPQGERDPAYRSWNGPEAHGTGGANAWSVIAADAARDLVIVPTTSPSVDYFGGHRLGENRYANSVVALRASSGALLWHFQTVHHDLWDYDNAGPPALVDIERNGQLVPAVLQATKSGQLFVLDRLTGTPLIPVEERPVPASTVPGEVAAPTQPFSSLPAISPQAYTAADMARTADPDGCAAAFSALRHDGVFTPPSVEGTLVLPANIGGGHWGGVAYDPASGIAVVPTNRLAAVVTLIPRATFEASGANVTNDERIGLEYARMAGTPYALRRSILASAGGTPCAPPPLGALVGVNLRTRTVAWSVPLGTAEGLERVIGRQAPNIQGMVNFGGAITTASGLTFIAATPDGYLRAFDTSSGDELWKGKLPAGGKASPMTYSAGGHQYVVIAAGGDGELFGRADEFVAFALAR